MKNIKIVLFLFLAGLLSMPLSAQKKCRVMSKNLKGSYIGGCNKGFAHGSGTAIGTDSYKGDFKKGYPNGKGSCSYSDGSFYVGEWKKGMRHGEGEYAFKVDGRDSIQAGKWRNDVYQGPIKKSPYRVEIARSVDRYTFRRVGDGNQVTIKFLQNGMTNSSIQNFTILGNRGSRVNVGSAIGYEYIDEFPFSCRVNYNTSNKLKTSNYDVLSHTRLG